MEEQSLVLGWGWPERGILGAAVEGRAGTEGRRRGSTVCLLPHRLEVLGRPPHPPHRLGGTLAGPPGGPGPRPAGVCDPVPPPCQGWVWPSAQEPQGQHLPPRIWSSGSQARDLRRPLPSLGAGVGGSVWALDRRPPGSTSGLHQLESRRVRWRLHLKRVPSQQLWGLPPASRVG